MERATPRRRPLCFDSNLTDGAAAVLRSHVAEVLAHGRLILAGGTRLALELERIVDEPHRREHTLHTAPVLGDGDAVGAAQKHEDQQAGGPRSQHSFVHGAVSARMRMVVINLSTCAGTVVPVQLVPVEILETS